MRITKRSIYAGLAGVGVLLGAGGLAAAATGDTPTPAAAVQQAQQDPAPFDDESTEDRTAEANEGPEDEANEGPENEADEGQQSGENEGPDTPPDYASSVQTAPEDESAETSETEASEAAEDEVLAALATVTPDEASAAALASQPGTVEDVELTNEAGNVVYEVEIVDDAGAEISVVVDAGNASVLASAAD